MTVVNLDVLRRELASPGGVSAGLVTVTYWAGSGPFINVDGDDVIFPGEIRVKVVDGTPETPLDLEPTGGVCCVRWVIRSLTTGETLPARFTSIPAVGPVDFGDLPIVDPTSFAPVDVTPTLIQTIDSRVGEAVPDAVADYLQENPPASAPDATTTAKGILQLAGDLGGNAAAPTVPGLAGKADTGHTHVSADVTDASSAATPSVMVLRDAAGRAKFADPSADADAATKGYVDDALDDKAPLASPVFTGDPKAPTPSTGDNDTSVATTAFVKAQGYAPLASPALTGNPTAPTQTAGNDSTRLATTAFVQAASGLLVPRSLVDAKGDLIVGTGNDTVSRLPVGSNGQVLTADSAESSGVKWAAPSGGGGLQPVRVAGRWHGPLISGGASDGGVMGAGVLWCLPSWSAGETYDAIWHRLTITDSDAVVRLGLYSVDPDTGLPADLLYDSGALSAATGGNRVVTISPAVTITGPYFACSVTNSETAKAYVFKGNPLDRNWIGSTNADNPPLQAVKLPGYDATDPLPATAVVSSPDYTSTQPVAVSLRRAEA